MKKSFLLFTTGLLSILFILCSCIPEFVNPLESPENNKPDPRLLGAWVEKDKPDNKEYMLFFLNPKGELIGKSFEKDSEGKNKEEEIPCIPSVFDEDTFLSVKLKDVESGETSDNYYIIKYEIKEDNLLFYHFKTEALIQAIKDKKIKGHIKTYKSSFKPENKEKTITNEDPIIEDSSENLIRFIRSMKKEELFDEPSISVRKKEQK